MRVRVRSRRTEREGLAKVGPGRVRFQEVSGRELLRRDDLVAAQVTQDRDLTCLGSTNRSVPHPVHHGGAPTPGSQRREKGGLAGGVDLLGRDLVETLEQVEQLGRGRDGRRCGAGR